MSGSISMTADYEINIMCIKYTSYSAYTVLLRKVGLLHSEVTPNSLFGTHFKMEDSLTAVTI